LSAAQTNPGGSPGTSGATGGESHAAPSQGGTSAHLKGAQSERMGQGQAEPKGHSGGANERMGQGQGGKSNERIGQGQGGKTNERMGLGQEKKSEEREQRQEHSGQTPGQRERMGQGREHQERNGESRQKERSGETREQRERTGETREQRDQSGTQSHQERMRQQERSQQDRAGENRTEGRIERGDAKNDAKNDAKSVQLNQEQRTRIHETIIKQREARVDHVDFDVRVGVRVPHTVHIFVVPEDVVRIVPQYRGYKYIIVRDEMVILDPDTLEIVAVVPV
jgi:hypothetical protein